MTLFPNPTMKSRPFSPILALWRPSVASLPTKSLEYLCRSCPAVASTSVVLLGLPWRIGVPLLLGLPVTLSSAATLKLTNLKTMICNLITSITPDVLVRDYGRVNFRLRVLVFQQSLLSGCFSIVTTHTDTIEFTSHKHMQMMIVSFQYKYVVTRCGNGSRILQVS